MSEVKEVRFTEGNLMKHVTVMSFTSSIGIMAIYVVDLFDIFFISLLGQKEMAAAAGYASTLMFFVSAINIGLSIAAGALIASALGASNRQKAREITSSVAVIATIIGIVFPLLMLPNIEYLLSLIGATGDVQEMAARYLWIILPATVFSGISMTAVVALRAYGEAKWAMYPSLAGAGVNFVMDPIFIFALGLGLEGAAVATVCARLATLYLAIRGSTRRSNAFVRPTMPMVVKHTGAIVRFAIPAVMQSIASPVAMAILTRYMAKFGSEAVAGMAVIGRLAPVVFSVVNALRGAVGPIIGQNYGAGRMDRVRETYFSGLKFLGIYVIATFTILFVLRVPIANAFGATGLTRELLYLFCGPLAVVAFFNGTIFLSNATFNNMGHPGYSSWLNWGRSTIGMLPFVHVGSLAFGAKGVLIGAVVGGAVFAAICAKISFNLMNRKIASQTPSEPELGYDQESEHVMVNQVNSIQ
ncbi:Multidrug export protein MepA [Roseovarius albus]|uniref:Multidrug export protein MepA n=1 Tax=Roseovarius albus TaxID=1247867 RepID=A0A1X6Z286_9RHOB|nr:MATE family efflux transporter [Roseovarius albus]SLN36536.1 Multidrug export protein MepA [Roseovarius albus]